MSETVIRNFAEACDKYASSKLILADRALGELLRLIANEPDIYAVLESSAKGFHFRQEFESAQIKTATGYQIRLPQSKHALVALVASILYSFDNGSISVLDFLEKFYPSTDGVKESFPVFTQEIVIPFRDAVIAIMKSGEKKEEKSTAINGYDDKPTPLMPEGVVYQGSMILRSMNKLIIENGAIESTIKNAYLDIIDGAIHALEIKDIKLVKSFFMAMCFVFEDMRALQSRLKELESCYRLYMIM